MWSDARNYADGLDGVTEGLVRIAVGIEATDDLVADVRRALDRSGA